MFKLLNTKRELPDQIYCFEGRQLKDEVFSQTDTVSIPDSHCKENKTQKLNTKQI